LARMPVRRRFNTGWAQQVSEHPPQDRRQ
jgi:hypothetical protein